MRSNRTKGAATERTEALRPFRAENIPAYADVARKNAVEFFETTGLANVEFREGHIENLP